MKLSELYSKLFKKSEPVSKELLSFEDWYKQKLEKEFKKNNAGRIIDLPHIHVTDNFDILEEYEEYKKNFIKNNRDEKIDQILGG